MSVRAGLRFVPGILVVILLAGLAFLAAHWTAPLGVGAVALGVFLGLVVGNTLTPRAAIEPGVRFAASRLLAVAVALLGLQIAFADLARFSLPLIVALGAVTASLIVAMGLGRLLGVAPRFAVLIGAGTGVCGVAAIAAVRPVVRASPTETTYAVSAVALLGSIGLVLFPLVQLAWHPISPQAFGVLAGASLHSVPQAVGAGFAGGGDASGTLATVVKLTRVVMLVPLVVLLLVIWPRTRRVGARVPRMPVEVVGFVVFVLMGNLLPLPLSLRAGAQVLSMVLLVAALTALGLLTQFRSVQQAGWRPVALAIVVWGVLVAGVFAVVATLDA